MPLDDLQRQVAVVVLREAKRHGFALAGGCALIAHGVVDRRTEDVDLFTDDETGVEAAAAAVEASLRSAGFQFEREDKTAGLAEVFPGVGDGLAEWIVTAPGGEDVRLQIAYFDRRHAPVATDVGPVLDLVDVIAGKVIALVPLTELRARSCRILGQRPHSVVSFPARDVRGGREGSGGADCAAHWEAARDWGSVGALPAA